MRILIDADACPVTRIAEEIAKEYEIECILYCDTCHLLESDYSQIKVFSKGADSVDFALINDAKKGDIVISQDYGVASMALTKACYAINQYGREYTNENIDDLLLMRHDSKKMRLSHQKSHLKGPRKRTVEDDDAFYNNFKQLIERVSDKND